MNTRGHAAFAAFLATAIMTLPALYLLWRSSPWLQARPADLLQVGAFSLASVFIIDLVGIASLGVAWKLASTRFGLMDVVSYCVAGAVMGAPMGLLIAYLFGFPGGSGFDGWMEQDHTGDYILLGVWFAALGAITALIFWLIRRPDRDPPPSSSRTREA